MKIAIVIHLFYLDLAQEFKEYFKNIPFKFDLYITTTKGSKNRLKEIFYKNIDNLNKLVIIETPNYGFDIAPFLVEFKKYYLKYDYVCKVHGKKSKRAPGLVYWRTYLLNNLLGSKNIIEKIINIFENDKGVGIIYPKDYYVMEESNKRDPWRRNWNNCEIIANRMGVDLDKNKNIEYPTGSMFWFRPKALKPLFDLDFEYSDFKETELWFDGTLAHAIERLFVVSANINNFKNRNILFTPTFKSASHNDRVKYYFYKMVMVIKKYVIYKMPYEWQNKFFRFINSIRISRD